MRRGKGDHMNRRRFLFWGASFVAHSLFSLNNISRAIAFDSQENPHTISPRIALIIDDIGFSPYLTRRFLALGVPITFSVLPCLRRSRDLAIEVHEHGHEVMLHQPMEPYSPFTDPGPGALYEGDTREWIHHVLEENMNSVPFAVGVNNHMGSKFTECQKEVRDVLKVIHGEGLFFVDSLTTSHSAAYETARNLHMRTACRNIFLDNICKETAVYAQLCSLAEGALRYGHAIGIGHPHPETALAIQRFLGVLKETGISLVHVSEVLPKA